MFSIGGTRWEAKSDRCQLWLQSIPTQVSWEISEKETQLNKGLEILWGSTSMNHTYMGPNAYGL